MKFKSILISLVLTCCFSSGQAFSDEATLWSYEYVLATAGSGQQLEPILNDIYVSGIELDEQFLDLMASVLIENYKDDYYFKDNMAWLVKVIVQSQNYRYRELVKTVTGHWNLRKVRGVVRKYLKKAKKSTVEQYEYSSVHGETLRLGYVQDAMAADPNKTEITPKLAKMADGFSIADMFKLAGKPHHIVSGATRVTDGFLIHLKFLRLTFFYKGQGRVTFAYDKGNDWGYRNTVLDPLGFEEYMPYRSQAKALGMISDHHLKIAMLMSAAPSSIKTVAEKVYNNGGENTELLDAAAELLITGFMESDDPLMIDSYSWVCKLLAKKGGGRYGDVLKFVEDNTSNKKLKRYAKTKIASSAVISSDRYKPGDVSLDKLKAKYPSPYPNLHTIKGRL